MTLKELREQRKSKVAEMRTISDALAKENRGYTEEEATKFDTLSGEVEQIDTTIERLSKLEDLEQRGRNIPDHGGVGRDDIDPDAGRTPEREAEQRTTAPSEEDRGLAMQAWFLRNSSAPRELDDRHVAACKKLRFNPDAKQLRFNLPQTHRFKKMQQAGWSGGYGRAYEGAEQRALSAVTGSAGGFLVPETMVNALEVNMLAFGGILQAAETIRTASGEPMTWPTANDTGNSGRQVGESQAVTTTDPTFSSVTWNAYKFSSDEILVPTELMEDSMFDLPGVLGSMLGERLGRILNTKFTTGTGAGTPKGLTVAASTGKTTASSTAITWDEIKDLIHSVDPAYRNGASFMFHDNIALLLKKLKDGEGRPLWADGPNSTPPATLMGYPYYINQDMSSTVTSGDITMTFGQHNKYKVRQVNDVRFYRLVERHRENDQDAFLAFIRADGNLLDAGTAPVKTMVQA